MKIIRYVLYLVGFIVFLLWFLFAHVVFYKKELTDMQYETKNHIIVKHYLASIVNPIGLETWITKGGEGLFVVLYDKNGKYLGQTSPFYMENWEGYMMLALSGPDGVRFPGNDPNKIWLTLGGSDVEEAYSVNIKHKKWWSAILQYFY